MKRREFIALAGCAAAWHARSSRNCRSLDISAPGRLKPTPLPFSLGFARAVPVPNFVFSDGSHSQERYVAVGTRVCGVFQIKRSILPSQGQIIFVSDPWITPHGRKGWKSSKAEAIAGLERRGLNVRGKTPAQIRKLLRLRFKKRSSNQTETRRADQ